MHKYHPEVLRATATTASATGFYRSICTRDGFEHEALEKLGHLISVVHVHGYLMFGSTPAFTDAVARRQGGSRKQTWGHFGLLLVYAVDKLTWQSPGAAKAWKKWDSQLCWVRGEGVDGERQLGIS